MTSTPTVTTTGVIPALLPLTPLASRAAILTAGSALALLAFLPIAMRRRAAQAAILKGPHPSDAVE
jgi:hypothetical protein